MAPFIDLAWRLLRLACLPALALPLFAADLQSIIWEGDDLPGHPNLSVNYAGPEALGPNGEIVATLTYTPPEGGIIQSMLAFAPNAGEPLVAVIKSGDSIAGAPGVYSSSGEVVVDAHGNLLLNALFQKPVWPHPQVILSGPPNALSTRIYEGQERPEIGAGMKVADRSINAYLNQNGTVAYLASLRPQSGIGFADAIWMGPHGGESVVLRTGRNYPGLPPEATLIEISDMRLNNDGVIAFNGRIQIENQRYYGLWLYESGALTEVARQGQPASVSNLPAGGTWTGANLLSFADNNYLAFRGSTTEGSGLFVAESNNATLILEHYNERDPGIAPGAGGAAFDLNFSIGQSDLKIASDGRAVLTSHLQLDTGDPVVTFDNRRGVWLWENGELSLVIRSGESSPRLPDPEPVVTAFGATFDANGRLFLTGSQLGLSNAVWTEDGEGNLVAAARAGQSIDREEGGDVTVDYVSLLWRWAGNGSDGTTSLTNAKGQVLIRAVESIDPFRDCLALATVGELSQPGSIFGSVRFDSDGDGDFLDPDPPIDGVTVELYATSDGVPFEDPYDVDTTDSEGSFFFDALPPGEYLLVETNPNTYLSTADTDSGDPDRITVLIESGEDDVESVFLDTLDSDTPLPAITSILLHNLDENGVSNSELGLQQIDAPLIPVTDPDTLLAQPIVRRGLAADGVTPLLISIAFAPDSLPEPREIMLRLDNRGGGNTLLGLDQELIVLDDGIWKSSTSPLEISAENPHAFAAVNTLLPDELSFTDYKAEIQARLVVDDPITGGAIGVRHFAIRKLPVTLVHGYNTTGEWGNAFFTELSKTRAMQGAADDFVIEIKYGQAYIEGFFEASHNLANTALPLRTLASTLEYELNAALLPLRPNWAFTRHDIVAHSQGGLLTRMLLSENPPDPVEHAFQSTQNFYRGRFHRAVTIGSPHNGSRLVRYIMRLAQTQSFDALKELQPGDYSHSHFFAALGVVNVSAALVQSGILRDKFDPAGTQIRQLNNPAPDAYWRPDPDARIHLVRTTSNQGMPPSAESSIFAHSILGLSRPFGEIVLPRGADGIVDFDSMGAHGPSQPSPDNVYTAPSDLEISHSGPARLFSRGVSGVVSPDIEEQTASPFVARHVRQALDQDPAANAADIAFGPFQIPERLTDEELDAINAAADGFTLIDVDNLSADEGLLPFSSHAQTSEFYSVTLAPPAEHPIADGQVFWYVEATTPQGYSTTGISWETNPNNLLELNVTIDPTVVGDIAAYASYLSQSGAIVASQPIHIATQLPADDPIASHALFPNNTTLEVGQSFRPELQSATVSGNQIQRFISPHTSFTSSHPNVIDVSRPRLWQAVGTGSATISAEIDGILVQTELAVSAPDIALSLEDWMALHFTPAQRGDSDISGLESDADGDGVTLLFEYLSGGDPWQRDETPLLSIDREGEELVLTLRRPDYQPEFSAPVLEQTASFTDWSTYYDPNADPDLQSPTILRIERAGEPFVLKIKLPEAPSSFLRLRSSQ